MGTTYQNPIGDVPITWSQELARSVILERRNRPSTTSWASSRGMSGPSSIYQDVKALQAVVAALQQANATQSSKIAELEYTAQASGDTGLPRGPDRDARCDRVLAVAPRVCPPRVLDVIGNPPPPLSLSRSQRGCS